MVIDLLKTTEDHENVEVAGGRPRVVPSVWLAYERQNNRWQNQHVRGHMFDTQINQWKEVEKRNVYNVAKCDKQHTYLAHLRHVHPIPYLYWKWTLHLVFTAYKSKFNLSFVLILYLVYCAFIYIQNICDILKLTAAYTWTERWGMCPLFTLGTGGENAKTRWLFSLPKMKFMAHSHGDN